MTKKKRVPSNAYFPDGLPYLGKSEGKKKSRKKPGSTQALYTIESASGEQDESSAVSVGSEDYAESLESFDQDHTARSSGNDDQYTGSKRSLTSSHASSEEGDSLVEVDDETLTNDDEYSSNCDDGTDTRVDSVLDTEDDDDDDTQEDTETIESNGSDDDTDTCLMSIDEHMARRHAKWFAMRFGRELKLCSSTEGAEFKSEKTERIRDGDGDADNDVCSGDEDSSMDETNIKSENDDASDMDTKTFKSENDTLDTKTCKSETGTRTGTTQSSTTMKSETSTKCETATRSETATKTETTCSMKSLVNTEGSSRQKSVVKSPPSKPEPQDAEQRELSRDQDTQNSDKSKMKKKKKKKSPAVAVAATTDCKSYRAQPGDYRKLQNVSQLSIVDIASSNRDISVVEPLKKRDAREAFMVRDVPHEIPAHAFLRDDISSIAPPVRSLYNTGPTSNGSIIHHGRNGRTKVLTRSRSQDVELGTGSDPSSGVIDQTFEKEQVIGICGLQRRGSDLELFFIGLISISLLVLVILLIVIVSRN